MSVEAAWVGQDPQDGGAEPFLLRSDDRALAAERGAIGGDAGDRDNARAMRGDQRAEAGAAVAEFVVGQFGGLRGGTRYQVALASGLNLIFPAAAL